MPQKPVVKMSGSHDIKRQSYSRTKPAGCVSEHVE
jgi:hypothetical protein